jgi:hypothetical protein
MCQFHEASINHKGRCATSGKIAGGRHPSLPVLKNRLKKEASVFIQEITDARKTNNRSPIQDIPKNEKVRINASRFSCQGCLFRAHGKEPGTIWRPTLSKREKAKRMHSRPFRKGLGTYCGSPIEREPKNKLSHFVGPLVSCLQACVT